MRIDTVAEKERKKPYVQQACTHSYFLFVERGLVHNESQGGHKGHVYALSAESGTHDAVGLHHVRGKDDRQKNMKEIALPYPPYPQKPVRNNRTYQE